MIYDRYFPLLLQRCKYITHIIVTKIFIICTITCLLVFVNSFFEKNGNNVKNWNFWQLRYQNDGISVFLILTNHTF